MCASRIQGDRYEHGDALGTPRLAHTDNAQRDAARVVNVENPKHLHTHKSKPSTFADTDYSEQNASSPAPFFLLSLTP